MKNKSSAMFTVFWLVGFMQERHRGTDFCSMSLDFTRGEVLTRQSSYTPQLRDEDIVIGDKLLFRAYDHQVIFEHFLQMVRKKFPGVPFQCLGVFKEGDFYEVRQIA